MIRLNGFYVKAEMNHYKGGEAFEDGVMWYESIAPEKVEEVKEKYGRKK